MDLMISIFDSFIVQEERDYPKYTEGAKRALQNEKSALINEQGSLTRIRNKLEEEFEDLVVELAKQGRNMEIKEKEAISRRKDTIRLRINKLEARMKTIDETLAGLKTMDLKNFLNQLKTLSVSFKAALPSTKDEIAQNIFLNLKTSGGKIVIATLKEPFRTMAESLDPKMVGLDGIEPSTNRLCISLSLS